MPTILALLLGLALLPGCDSRPTTPPGAQPAATPVAPLAEAEALVRELYAPYLAGGGGGPGLERSGQLTASFQTLWDQDARLAETRDGPGPISFDVVVNAQDWSVSDLELAATRDGTHATVVATFKNYETPVTVTWELLLEGQRWKVDNVKPEGFDVRAALRGALPATTTPVPP